MASKQLVKAKLNGPKKEGIALYLDLIRQGPDAEWTKDDLLSCVHWQKQLTAAVLGLLWGVLPLQGLEGFAGFFVLQLLVTTLFYRLVLRVNEEVHGGVGEALFEGLPTFTAVFVLFWVVTFNVLHV
ncbi:hypothetical protein Agub_g11393 [Astrephomene gubernaculifera]|uniref:Rab5-interacting protein n=1 Tax=Astrephomene gubernaculifera TaxID=47775 RepID=A0AAD3DY57_9CHLO|nr:hypothetical protein Agub_g11393 [Astrephomene gubernaculifera]